MAGTSLDDLLAALNVLIDELRLLRGEVAASSSNGGPDYFTIKAAAEYTSRTEEAIRSAVKRGQIETTRGTTRTFIIPRRSLDRFVDLNGDQS